jgi:2-amino-4-hydroxy-6-hydroxymethyldihydropteridine diphosphokinase
MEKVVLIVGGNLGNRLALIEEANFLLSQIFGNPQAFSSIYETEAWGGLSSFNYLNQVLVYETNEKPQFILNSIMNIEQKMGRQRKVKWGDRNMDIDILYYGSKLINKEDLTIPHPFIQDRRFVLVPLNDVLPDFVHPILFKSHSELLDLCKDQSQVSVY